MLDALLRSEAARGSLSILDCSCRIGTRWIGFAWIGFALLGHRLTAVLRDELHDMLEEAGFSDIDWKMPAESGYYQPIVTARV